MDKQNATSTTKQWIATGLSWGLLMFIAMVLVFPLVVEGESYTWKKIVLGFFLWMIGGLGFGYLNKALRESDSMSGLRPGFC